MPAVKFCTALLLHPAFDDCRCTLQLAEHTYQGHKLLCRSLLISYGFGTQHIVVVLLQRDVGTEFDQGLGVGRASGLPLYGHNSPSFIIASPSQNDPTILPSLAAVVGAVPMLFQLCACSCFVGRRQEGADSSERRGACLLLPSTMRALTCRGQ